jgi:hypothetical protein
MSTFWTNPNPNPKDAILRLILIYSGMRKIVDEKIDKIKQNDENISCLDGITSPEGRFLFIFAIPTGSDAL